MWEPRHREFEWLSDVLAVGDTPVWVSWGPIHLAGYAENAKLWPPYQGYHTGPCLLWEALRDITTFPPQDKAGLLPACYKVVGSLSLGSSPVIQPAAWQRHIQTLLSTSCNLRVRENWCRYTDTFAFCCVVNTKVLCLWPMSLMSSCKYSWNYRVKSNPGLTTSSGREEKGTIIFWLLTLFLSFRNIAICL